MVSGSRACICGDGLFLMQSSRVWTRGRVFGLGSVCTRIIRVNAISISINSNIFHVSHVFNASVLDSTSLSPLSHIT